MLDSLIFILIVSLLLGIPLASLFIYIIINNKLLPIMQFRYIDQTTSTKFDPHKLLHHPTKPSIVIRNKNRHLVTEIYYFQGEIHNIHAPAVVKYSGSKINSTIETKYYIHGTQLSEQLFNEIQVSSLENLAQYLVDPRPHIRFLANIRLEHLKENKHV